jgi:hypothetical protein
MIKQVLVPSLFSLVILSCGSDNDVEIKTFEVRVTSDVLEDGSVPIDPAVNGGRFDLIWKVDDAGAFGYTTRFYLSVNTNLDKSNDILFGTVGCDAFGSCDHDTQNAEECYFTNNMVMFCGDEDDATKYDVDEIIDSLPMDANIIIEACTTFDCDTQHRPVRLL